MTWAGLCSLLLGVLHDHEESNEEIDGIKVDSNGVTKWIIVLVGFGVVQDCLSLEESQHSGKTKTSVKPQIEKSLGSWVHDAED